MRWKCRLGLYQNNLLVVKIRDNITVLTHQTGNLLIAELSKKNLYFLYDNKLLYNFACFVLPFLWSL